MTEFTLNVSDSRVAIIYSTKDKVLQAKTVLKRKLGIGENNLKVISPDDNNMEQKLEGRSEKVGDNMLNLHFFYGAMGLIIGMIFAHILVNYGPMWTQQNPMFTYLALVSPGLFIGLFVAGFLSLKPEHDVVNQTVVENKNENNWTLIVDTEEIDISRDDIIDEIKQTDPLDVQK